MSQSEILVGTLLAGFVVFLAMNNRLPVYWALLTGGTSGAAATAAPYAGAGTATTPPQSGSGYSGPGTATTPPQPGSGY